MTRRNWLAFIATPLLAQPDTPRNRLCNAANEFNLAFSAWAKAMNEHRDTVDMGAIEAWIPLPDAWRKVERQWKEWLVGR